MRRSPTPDWRHVDWHYATIHAILSNTQNRLWMRMKGRENLPEGGFLFAANHTSWWDPIMMQASIPRPVFMLAKKEVAGNAFTKWFFGRGGAIFIDRKTTNPQAYANAVGALKDDRIIGIFPEATRHVGQLGKPKTGVARMAMESGAPIVPMGIASDRFWPPGKAVPNLLEKVYMNVGKPLHLKGDPLDKDAARAGAEQVMAAIGELLAEAQKARDAKADWPAPV